MKAIILAGGKGSRLWPLSRDMYPKQLLSIDENQSLLQATFKRLLKITSVQDIITITNIKHYNDIKLQLNQISNENVVVTEPLGRNTAPAIACALRYFSQHDSQDDDLVLILPADHLIRNVLAFRESIKKAVALAEQNYIVTFGIKPAYPETGYGYIKIGNPVLGGFAVDSFVEKPDFTTAEQYIADGNYFWNGGMFMGKLSVLREEYQKYCPEIYNHALLIDFSQDRKIPFEIYDDMPNISLDYAIMEKSDRISLVELQSDWTDLGSWQSLYSIRNKDENNNVLKGKVIVNNVKNSFIYSQKELVAVSDLEDIILIETEDAVMACKMSESQNVKILYDKLNSSDSELVKLHKTVFRPWGHYTCLNNGKGYLTKNICVFPNQKLSLQSHKHRSEHWVVLDGKALVVLNDEEFVLDAGKSIDIPVNAIHSLQNPYDEMLNVLEVQRGDILSEDDIVRYADSYGRA